jgi:hypothetical protein
MWWGIVEDVKDPEERHRIKAKVPDVLGSEISDWAEPDSLAISKLKRGDKVWIRFLTGDTRHAFYHIPNDHKLRALLYNADDGIDLTHPVAGMRLRAPAGTAMMSGSSSSVNAAGGQVHCQGKDGAGYVPCVASAFLEGSSEHLKDHIRVLDFDPVKAIQDAPAKLWNYRPEVSPDGRTKIGPIAETLPDLVRNGDNVDLAALVGVLWAAVDHLSRRVEELEARP